MQPIIRIVDDLPGTVGAEEPERLAAADLDVDAVDSGQVAEALDQIVSDDQRVRPHRLGDPAAAPRTWVRG